MSASSRTPPRSARFAFAVLAALALVWIGYKVTTIRSMTGQVTVDTGCETNPNTVAEMKHIQAGAASIRCEPWDIGTGVTGYVWHAAGPRAALLIAHGWGDYAQRYVTQFGQLIPHILALGIRVYDKDIWTNCSSHG